MRLHAIAHALVFALVVAGSLVAEDSARAQTPAQTDEAKRAFEDGVALEKSGDFPAALARFREAAQIKATPGVRFHEGYCLEMTGKLASALEAYDAAEKMAREQNKADVLAAVRARLEPLASRVPQIVIHVEPKTASVRVDGTPVSAAVVSGQPLRVDPGNHDVAAQAAGRAPKIVRITASDGETANVTLALDPAPPSVPAPAPAPLAPSADVAPPQETPSRSIAVPLAVTGGAVVFAVGGIAAFALAGSAQSDAERDCPLKISCESEKSEVRTLDALALAGFIGAAGLGALAVALWSSHGSSSANVAVAVAGSSIRLQGEF